MPTVVHKKFIQGTPDGLNRSQTHCPKSFFPIVDIPTNAGIWHPEMREGKQKLFPPIPTPRCYPFCNNNKCTYSVRKGYEADC